MVALSLRQHSVIAAKKPDQGLHLRRLWHQRPDLRPKSDRKPTGREHFTQMQLHHGHRLPNAQPANCLSSRFSFHFRTWTLGLITLFSTERPDCTSQNRRLYQRVDHKTVPGQVQQNQTAQLLPARLANGSSDDKGARAHLGRHPVVRANGKKDQADAVRVVWRVQKRLVTLAHDGDRPESGWRGANLLRYVEHKTSESAGSGCYYVFPL
jgi:hypothetical protein